MDKKRWNGITRFRLRKWGVNPEDLDDPLKWPNLIKFEIQHYGTNTTKRLYLMRRWQKRIMDISDGYGKFKLDLFEILSDSLVRKTQFQDNLRNAEISPN